MICAEQLRLSDLDKKEIIVRGNRYTVNVFNRDVTLSTRDLKKIINMAEDAPPHTAANMFGGFFRVLPVHTCDPPVALRMMLNTSDWKAKDEIMKETQLYQQIKHENIVPLLCLFGSGKKGIVQVMPLYAGDLIDYSNTYAYNTKDVCQFVLPICSALSYLHDKKLVHCDVKMDNILYRSHQGEKHIALTDFGMSGAIGSPIHGIGIKNCAPEISMAWQFYIKEGSPELAGVKFSATYARMPENDIWSLGFFITYMLDPVSYPEDFSKERQYYSDFIEGSSMGKPDIIKTIVEKLVSSTSLAEKKIDSKKAEARLHFCNIKDTVKDKEAATKLFHIARSTMQVKPQNRISIHETTRQARDLLAFISANTEDKVKDQSVDENEKGVLPVESLQQLKIKS